MHMKKLFLLLPVLWLLHLQHAYSQCNGTPPTVQITPSPAILDCLNPVVQLQGTITPPTGNYSFQWFGPVSNPTVLNPFVGQPGNVALFVYDSLTGCVGADTTLVLGDLATPSITFNALAPCDPENEPMLLTAFVTNGNGPFEYEWTPGGATTQTIEAIVNGPTTFCVTVTNVGAGCSAVQCITLTPPVPLSVSISYFDSPFCNDSLGTTAIVQGGNPPYTYTWNNGSSSPWINDPPAGTYVVTVTDAAGCSAVASIVVENEPDECANLEGYVYADWNTNCTVEASDVPLKYMAIKVTDASGNEYYTTTDVDGFYRVEMNPGTYDVIVLPINSLWEPCPASVTVSIGANQTITQDFLLQPQAVCPAMTVDISIPFLRRCFSSTVWVNYCNQGTEDATDSHVEILFDPFLTPNSASVPFTSLGNDVYSFDLGTVPFNTCGSFWINVSVSCNAVLGQTHCLEGVIYPTGNCEPQNAMWSGASLQLNAQCNSDSLDFEIKNIGAGPMSVPLDYVVIEDAVMYEHPSPGVSLAPSESYHVKVPANGATWRLEVPQEPFHPGSSMPSLSVEGCVTGNQFTTGFVNQFPQNDDDPWVDIECRANQGSYDPNDKQGFPLGYGTAHYVRPGTDIEYLIRFQNTGTDTAFTVVIRDELSPWLDAGSVVPGAGSHPYTFEYYGDRNIKFTFDNILLPDSSTNLEASQGFVSFRVAQQANVPLETDILNRAGIFFDFNEPVYTNTTTHRVGDNFVVVNTWQPFVDGLSLRVVPNPVAETAMLVIEGLSQQSGWQVAMYDATGKLVRTGNLENRQWKLERGQLPSGMYFLKVISGSTVLGTGKLMLK